MRWSFFSSHDSHPAPERFRRQHEAFLDAAIRSGRAFPRIPLRRDDRGGFDPLRARPGGRGRADRWWNLAFARLDSAER
jgi:hypothetical protein